jgi:hypothetical protein
VFGFDQETGIVKARTRATREPDPIPPKMPVGLFPSLFAHIYGFSKFPLAANSIAARSLTRTSTTGLSRWRSSSVQIEMCSLSATFGHGGLRPLPLRKYLSVSSKAIPKNCGKSS